MAMKAPLVQLVGDYGPGDPRVRRGGAGTRARRARRGDRAKVTLPAIAALGVMIVLAAIYLALAPSGDAADAWAP
jgi:hypothetical protein